MLTKLNFIVEMAGDLGLGQQGNEVRDAVLFFITSATN